MWVHVAPIAQHCKGTFCGIEQPHSHVCACNRHTVTWTMQHSWQHCPYYGCRPLRRICRWYGVASQKGDLQLATACPNIICCTPVQAVAPHRSVYKCSLLIAFGEGPVTALWAGLAPVINKLLYITHTQRASASTQQLSLLLAPLRAEQWGASHGDHP